MRHSYLILTSYSKDSNFSNLSLFSPIKAIIQSTLFLSTLLLVTSCDSVSVTSNLVWSTFYFSGSVYLLLFITVVLYLIPNLPLFVSSTYSKTSSGFSSTDGISVTKLLLTPLFLLALLHFSWCGPTVTAWFDHIVFSNLQFKITLFLIFFFSTYLLVLTNTSHFSSLLLYDFTSTTFNFFVWLWVLFFSNNLFTFIFFLELLSVLVALLVITSTFSSAHFYNNLSFSSHTYFQSSVPTSLLQTLMFFFWITLVASLSLFIFLTLFYTKVLTFEWTTIDVVFLHLVSLQSMKSMFTLSCVWTFLLICIFLKCGIAPLHLWKPTFFKGLPTLTLFFYIYVYYFSIFFYFTYVLLLLLNEMLIFNLYVLVALVIVSSLSVTFLLFESFYLKSFLAMSSILNSLLIFYMMISPQASDFLFIL